MKENRASEKMPAREAAVLYLRLSSADGPAAESDSIQNQRAFLQEWAQGHGFRVVREFVDAPDIIGLKQNPTKRASL